MMMKKLTFLLIGLTISTLTMASRLFLLPTGSIEQIKAAFNQQEFLIHFYNDEFLIASTDSRLPSNSVLLDENAWSEASTEYFLLRTVAENRDQYVQTIVNIAEILYNSPGFIIVSIAEENAGRLLPAVHGGIIRISNTAAKFPPRSLNYTPGSLQFRDYIADMIAQVNIDTLEAYVQHLQDFGTRNAYKAGGIEAQNWILGKFQSYGLNVELHDFTMPGGPASDNVIATLTGTEFPDEYVILGAHYDSYAGGNTEPGADDNATGTAGILEAARIMSQYQFDRTIIFATWSGEEYGLYGSDAWATEAAQNEMNILGYFNIDMAGYLQPGDVIHTDIIAPVSASELKQFYKDICAIYLPDFQTNNGALSGGDSDHTSFNNNGFQGIFPFEDSQNYSPYIHTANDLIGLSVNNFEQHMTFVKATVANVASLSNQLPTPENLTAIAGDQQVDLSWEALEGVANYNIYRNSGPEPYASTTESSYADSEVENGTSYTYYITAVFQESGEESGPSNLVTVIPMPPIALPFFDDFETGAPYWTMENDWGLIEGVYHSTANSLTESPAGNYEANMNSSVTLRALDFSGASAATVSFWTRYNIESGYDYMYLEVSADGNDWDALDAFTGVQTNWVEKSYSLSDYLGMSNVILRFRFTSDVYIEAQGMNIDDLEVMVSGVGYDEKIPVSEKYDLQFNPNPARQNPLIIYTVETDGMTKITLADASGRVVRTIEDQYVKAGTHQIGLDITNLPDGIYYATLKSQGIAITRKLVLSK